MDWMSLTLEIIGLIIFVVWFILPIREFRQIYLRIKAQREAAARRSGDTGAAGQ
jgi:hypothetical protein